MARLSLKNKKLKNIGKVALVIVIVISLLVYSMHKKNLSKVLEGDCDQDKELLALILQNPKKEYPPERYANKKIYTDAYLNRIEPEHHLNLKEVLKESEQYISSKVFKEVVDVTIILNHFQRRSLCTQLDALLAQTAQPKHIWVCLFNSPEADLYRRIIAEYDDPRIEYIESEYNFKFYGRFQLALEAPTKYVWVVDDDMMSGPRYLEQLLRVVQVPRYRGMLGSIGWVLPQPNTETFEVASYRSEGLYIPDPAFDFYAETMSPVDLLCSMWFFEQEWTKYLFREEQFTYGTGEDFYLSYVMKKYGNINSFVIPVNVDDKDTWGDLYHGFASHKGATGDAGGTNVMTRDDLSWHIFQRGNRHVWTRDILQFRDTLHRALMIVVNGESQGNALRAIANLLNEEDFTIVVANECERTLSKMGMNREQCSDHHFGVFNLGVDSADEYSPVFYGMRQLLLAYQPAAVIILDDGMPFYNVVQNAIEDANSQLSENTALISIPIGSVARFHFITTLPDMWALRNWNRPKLVIHLLALTDAKSQLKLMTSLNQVDYMGDEVSLFIHIQQGMPQAVHDLAHSFVWAHGAKTIRTRLVGSAYISLITEAWNPSSLDEYAMFVEDDEILSPYAYQWFKHNIMQYKYTDSAVVQDVYGLSLTAMTSIETIYPNQQFRGNGYFGGGENEYSPFLHPQPSTWGSIFFPDMWMKFVDYVNEQKSAAERENTHVKASMMVHDIIHGASGYKDKWRRLLTEMAYKEALFMLYPNFWNGTSLAVHGYSNHHGNKGSGYYDSVDGHALGSEDSSMVQHTDHHPVELPLMTRDIILAQLPHHHLPMPDYLPVLDL